VIFFFSVEELIQPVGHYSLVGAFEKKKKETVSRIVREEQLRKEGGESDLTEKYEKFLKKKITPLLG